MPRTHYLTPAERNRTPSGGRFAPTGPGSGVPTTNRRSLPTGSFQPPHLRTPHTRSGEPPNQTRTVRPQASPFTRSGEPPNQTRTIRPQPDGNVVGNPGDTFRDLDFGPGFLSSNPFTPGNSVGDGITLPEDREYSPEPPPLSAAEIGQFDRRRREASSAFRELSNQIERQRSNVQSGFERGRGGIARQAQGARRQVAQETADRGLGFSPAFRGVGEAQVRDQRAVAQAELEADRARQLAELQEMMNQGERLREQQLANISDDERVLRANLERMFPGVRR